ncbi:hypothetical protein Nepgr_015773 [Nepenthes gracilis]|uniref:Uncharacterized protein n=1 Tax=Nepenthes gracilis TaxID=150966 RepID=A0AAD3XQN7_NEPGR|nr:hypothetical protein Nepgr_015773 [Nepenthes gracilis]
MSSLYASSSCFSCHLPVPEANPSMQPVPHRWKTSPLIIALASLIEMVETVVAVAGVILGDGVEAAEVEEMVGMGGDGDGGGGGGQSRGWWRWGCRAGRGGRRLHHHGHHRKRNFRTTDYQMGEFAECKVIGRCHLMRLDCPHHCGRACFYDCRDACEAHCLR